MRRFLIYLLLLTAMIIQSYAQRVTQTFQVQDSATIRNTIGQSTGSYYASSTFTHIEYNLGSNLEARIIRQWDLSAVPNDAEILSVRLFVVPLSTYGISNLNLRFYIIPEHITIGSTCDSLWKYTDNEDTIYTLAGGSIDSEIGIDIYDKADIAIFQNALLNDTITLGLRSDNAPRDTAILI